MKTLKITAPPGHEIDKEKSTFKEIVFKKSEIELLDSVKEIPNRNYFLAGDEVASINTKYYNELDQVSTKKRAEAFLALMQLVELRDYVNGNWRANWGNLSEIKYGLHFELEGKPTLSRVLHFKSMELRDKFSEKYSDLIEEAKELL